MNSWMHKEYILMFKYNNVHTYKNIYSCFIKLCFFTFSIQEMAGIFLDTNCQYDVSWNPRIPLGLPGRTVKHQNGNDFDILNSYKRPLYETMKIYMYI